MMRGGGNTMSYKVIISRNGGGYMRSRAMKFMVGVVAAAVGLVSLHGLGVPDVQAAAITNCNGCHGYPSPIGTYADGSARNTPNGQFPGTHNTHVNGVSTTAGPYFYTCDKCHIAPNSTSTINNAHQTGFINIANPINSNTGASYGGIGSWARTNSPTFRTCSNVYCHSDGTGVATGVVTTNVSPLWGTVASGCGTCHNATGPNQPNIRHNAGLSTASAGWANPENASGNSDNLYATYNTNSQAWLIARNFGWNTADVAPGDTINGFGVVVDGWGSSGTAADRTVNVGLSKNGGTTIIGTMSLQMSTLDNMNVAGGPTSKFGGTWVPADVWNTFAVMIQKSSNVVAPIIIDTVKVVIYTDHSPKMNSHLSHTSPSCDTCHHATVSSSTTISNYTNHNDGNYDLQADGAIATFAYTYAANGSKCSNISCHGNATWGASAFDCVSCHNQTQPISKGPLAGQSRRNVSGEFLSTWSHARSNNRVVTKAMCVVCHMEGNPASGSQDGTYHGNGLVDLRDPDTGAQIRQVRWIQSTISQGGGWYTSDDGTVDGFSTFARFIRNITTSSLEPWVQAVQINMCLKCHDYNGAMSTLARVGGNSTSALQPFNVLITHWNSTAAMSSMGNHTNGSGNVVNVKYSFITTNASYHPVMGKSNNASTATGRMVAPWNSIGKIFGTNTQYGYLMSCWDCHAQPGASGILTFSVTAHGAAATLRSPIRANSTTPAGNLCLVCHVQQYETSMTASGHHGAVAGMQTSAMAGGSDPAMSSFGGRCYYCHGVGFGVSSIGVNGSGTLNDALTRPLRAQDAHGFNDRYANSPGSRWNSGTRPYAFFRNVLTNWRPARSPETANNTGGICTGITGRTCDNNMGGTAGYTPGGVF